MSTGLVYGSYYLLGRLNAGGMAEVYLARTLDPARTAQLLAIKRMLPQLTSDSEFVSMFSDEARIAKGLSHPNICKIYEQGEHASQLYIVMEFIHGKDLKVVQRRAEQRNEPVPQRVAAFAIAKMAEALDYAHGKTNERGETEGIVHRDISPQNILLSYDGVPKLIDFGIAKARDRVVKTRVGVVKGKFAYMAPEQASGAQADRRSDIFSLGVVLYELLTNKLPFSGSGDISVLQRISKGEYAPIAQLNADIPRRLASVVERAMLRDPTKRYQRGSEMAADLHRYLADERRDMSESVVSSYMRRLFRDDYIGEMGRIKDYLSVDVQKAAAAPEASVPKSMRLTRDRIPGEEPSSPRILAAGYDGTQVSAELELALQVEPGKDAGMFEEKTREVRPPSDQVALQGFEAAIDERTVPITAQAAALLKDDESRSMFNPPTIELDIASIVEPTSVGKQASAELRTRKLGPEEVAQVNAVVRPERDTAPTPALTPAAEKNTEEKSDSFEINIDEQAVVVEPTHHNATPVTTTKRDASPPEARPRRPALLSRGEAVILMVVAALGVGLVFGAYWYAANMPVYIPAAPVTDSARYP